MYFVICALTSNWCEIPLYFFPHLNLRACRSKMALFQKTKYTICFISVSDACTWHAIKIEENFQKSPRPRGGVNFFQKCLKFKNVPNVGGGGGVNPNWDIVPNFLVFFSDASPKILG